MFIKQIFKGTNTKIRIFRIFNTFGPGENMKNLKKGMVSIYCSYIWRKKPLLVKGSLKRFRNFTYISDCVHILNESIKNKKLKKFEIINLSNEKKFSVEELINKILKVNKLKNWKIINRKGTPGDSFSTFTSNQYLRKKFNNHNFINLDEGLRRYFLWIKKINKKSFSKSHPYHLDKNYNI